MNQGNAAVLLASWRALSAEVEQAIAKQGDIQIEVSTPPVEDEPANGWERWKPGPYRYITVRLPNRPAERSS